MSQSLMCGFQTVAERKMKECWEKECWLFKSQGFPCDSDSKKSACNAEDWA